jgi:hypothetical protein
MDGMLATVAAFSEVVEGGPAYTPFSRFHPRTAGLEYAIEGVRSFPAKSAVRARTAA